MSKKRWEDDDQVPTITYSVDMNLSKTLREWKTEDLGMLQSMQRVESNLATQQQRKGEGTWPFSTIIIFSLSFRMSSNTNRRGLRGYFGGQCFSSVNVLCFWVWSKFCSSNGKVLLLGAVSFLADFCHRLKITLDSFWVSLMSRILWVPENCVLQANNAYKKRETKNGAVLLMPMRPCPIKHLLTKPRLREKIIKNFKKATMEHSTKHGALLHMGPCETAEGAHPWCCSWPQPYTV